MKEFRWTERKIQGKLISQYWSSSILLMPNYTPWQWFECDLFRVTKSLYFYEYEIKLTVSDFKADARKICSTSFWDENGHWQRGPNRHKHDLLRERSEKGPKRFYYVVP
ncbi:hypothetical protein LCGC14_2693070, partial [marine sediment metagenome]